jgi:hypothetical protein
MSVIKNYIIVVLCLICGVTGLAESSTWPKNLEVLQQQQNLITSIECKYLNEGDGGKTSLYMELIWKYVGRGYYYSIVKKNLAGQEKNICGHMTVKEDMP